MNKIYINKKGNATLVMVMIPIGSYYEPNRIKGVSHFLEHFCFKGTKTRTRKDIDIAIEGVGGDINAYTSEELTCYWAKVANKHKDMAINVITDLALNPIFPVKEIDKEREVIIQELKMYADNPQSEVCELFNKIYYPEISGYHFPIVGTIDSLSHIGRKELMQYHKLFYNNPTLIVIGEVKNKQDINQENIDLTDNNIYKPKISKYIEKRKQEQANIIIGNDVYLPQYSQTDKVLMLDLLSLIFNGMSGRLFEEVREKNNLVYRIKFYSELWSGGMISWGVSLGLDQSKISKARKLIEKELTKPISKQELENTIIKTVGTHALEIEDLNTIAEMVVYGLRKDINWKELYYNYDKQIYKIAQELPNFLKSLNLQQNLMVGIVPK